MSVNLSYKSSQGKVAFHTDICVLCGTCQYVCPAGAINIEESSDKKGFDFEVWHNTCTLCGNCEYFCPTKSIHLSHDTNEINLQVNKYKNITYGQVKYVKCSNCKQDMVKVTNELLLRGFGYINEDIKKLSNLCSDCRTKTTFDKRVKLK